MWLLRSCLTSLNVIFFICKIEVLQSLQARFSWKSNKVTHVLMCWKIRKQSSFPVILIKDPYQAAGIVFHLQDSYLLNTFVLIKKIYVLKCESQERNTEGEGISTNSTSVPTSIISPAVVERWVRHDSCLGVHNTLGRQTRESHHLDKWKSKKAGWCIIFSI